MYIIAESANLPPQDALYSVEAQFEVKCCCLTTFKPVTKVLSMILCYEQTNVPQLDIVCVIRYESPGFELYKRLS